MNLTTNVLHTGLPSLSGKREVIKRLQMREPPVQLGTMAFEGVEGAGLGKHRITDAIPRPRLAQRLWVCFRAGKKPADT